LPGSSEPEVVAVDVLLFPRARQALRTQRRRRLYEAKKWSGEIVCAITDLPAEQVDAAAIAAWTRGPRTVENTVHWIGDLVFGEGKSQVGTRNTPAVPAAVRDLIRRALKLAGYVNTSAGRRAPHRTPLRPRPLRHHMNSRTSEANTGALSTPLTPFSLAPTLPEGHIAFGPSTTTLRPGLSLDEQSRTALATRPGSPSAFEQILSESLTSPEGLRTLCQQALT
jgi:hypothetical protein